MSADSHRRGFLHFCKHHILLRSFRLLVWSIPPVTVIAVLASVYLAVVGIPSPLVKDLLSRFEQEGIHFEAESMYFNVLRGLYARDFKYFNSRKYPIPVIEAEQVHLDIDTFRMLREGFGLQAIRVYDGTIRIGPEMDAFGPMVGKSLDFTNADLDIRFSKEGDVHIDRLVARCVGIMIDASGTIVVGKSLDDASSLKRPRRRPGEIQAALEKRPPWFGNLIEQINRVQFEEPPTLDLEFTLVVSDWTQSRARLLGQGGASKVRGIRLDGWDLDAAMEGNDLILNRVLASDGPHRVKMEGTWGMDDRALEGTLESSLLASHWLSFIPISWRDGLRESSLFFEGPIDASLSFGPAPLSNLFEQCAGTMSVHQVEAKGVWVEEAGFNFTKDAEQFELRDIDATVGREAQQGELDGSFVFDLTSGVYTGYADSRLDYNALLPILSTGLTKLVHNATFPDGLSHSRLRFGGARGKAGSFGVIGVIAATNFIWRGSHCEEFEADLLVTNRIVALDPFLAAREEGKAEGSIIIHSAEKRIDIDLVSSVDAEAAGRAVGPYLERILNIFRFEGPATATVAGVVHTGTNGITELTADVISQDTGYKWFLADQADFTVVISNKNVDVRDISCRIYDGTVNGWFQTFPAPGTTNRGYAMELEAEDTDFSQLVTALKQVEGDPYKGRLSGQLELSGLIGKGQSPSAVGEGTIRIREGYLLQIPLFGGLSSQLSKLITGLGFAKQTDFNMDFIVTNRLVHTDEAEIDGTVLSLEADGEYHFDHSLDFDVVIKLLRDKTGVGKAIQIVTSPVSKLFEFRLEGTPENPVWSSKHIPKELQGDDGSDGEEEGQEDG